MVTVERCVTQYYEDERGRWFWHCLTCDDGTNRVGRHPQGHKRESDAKCGADSHARDKTAHRLKTARYLDWRARLVAASTPDEYLPIFEERFPQFAWKPGTRNVHPFNARGSMELTQRLFGND